MKLAIIGSGYVGLVAGTCFAESGNDVVCVDVNEERVNKLRDGIVPIYEPGLERLLKRNSHEGRLHFTTDTAAAVQDSDIIFLAVGTPPRDDGKADLSQVEAVGRSIGEAINGYKVVVIKSTVPIGTSDRVRELISERSDQPFDMVSNPEFLKEGAAINDFLKPDRIVIGTNSERARSMMAKLYAPFVRTQNPIYFMDLRSAELTKYAANAMLATRISFMNELSKLAEKIGADITEVRRGIGSDERIGRHFLFPGVGYGGSCFPKDIKALIGTGEEYGSPLQIVGAVDRVNDLQKRVLGDKIAQHFDGDLSGRTVAVWGLAFKPNTDDMREAPAVVLIEQLLAQDVKVRVFDPVAMEVARGQLGDRVTYCETNYEAIEGADALAIVTEWNEFRSPNFAKMRGLMRGAVIFDGRNIYDPGQMKEQGFCYYCIGRVTD